jgi:hypothetical protein
VKLLRTLSLGKQATSRRQLLKALGVSVAAAPFIPTLDGWAAPGATPPKRLLLLFSPHGVIPENYWPTGADTNFAFPAGSILEPFAPHKNDMIVFKGLKRPTKGRGAHEIVMVNLWTGTSMHPSTQDATGPSIDQVIAKALPKETTYESLQFGVQTTFWGEGDITSRLGSPNSTMIYAGTQQRMYPENDPYKMFDRLFAMPGDTGNATQAAKARAQRKSLLDFVQLELGDVSAKVGKDDQTKIASHLEATRALERQLQDPAKTCGGVTRPDGMIDLAANANHPALIPIANQLVLSALTCDRTRVASLQYSRSFSLQKHTWLGATDGHHPISHNQGAKKILTDIQRWYMGHFASLIAGLKGVQEGGKPMLDNMLVVYVSELYTPWNHVADPSACFMFGKLGGVIPRTGRMIDYAGGHDHNQFLVSICQAMGLSTTSKVGDLGGQGPLPNLLG